MYSLHFHPEAITELEESIFFYEKRSSKVANNFKAEIKQAFQYIEELPHSSPKIFDNFHSFIMIKFPYKIIYSINNEVINILAVIHTSRNPDLWKDRI